jgi:hypothetical protein
MAGTEMKNVVLIALVVLVILFVVYQYDPSFFGLFGRREGFTSDVMASAGKLSSAHGDKKAGFTDANGKKQGFQNANADSVNQGAMNAGMDANSPPTMATDYTTETAMKAGSGVQGSMPAGEGFADLSAYEGPASFGAAEAPAGCYPRDQLTPSELLPKDMNSIWAEQNPMGPGSLKGKNFLSAGALIGVNTVGQSLRNANLQVRSEPPNPQVPVSVFNQSTISPDISHRPLEIGA